VGHALYLAAESVGLNATGIGAFFDSDVLQTLSLDDNWIVVYHFTIGKSIPDLRVRQLPGYDFEREIIK
jgi:nitroreductase